MVLEKFPCCPKLSKEERSDHSSVLGENLYSRATQAPRSGFRVEGFRGVGFRWLGFRSFSEVTLFRRVIGHLDP